MSLCRFIYYNYNYINIYIIYIIVCVQHSGSAGPVSQCATCKCNWLNEVTQYKTLCSWSLLLLHNTVGGVLWAGETLVGCLVIF